MNSAAQSLASDSGERQASKTSKPGGGGHFTAVPEYERYGVRLSDNALAQARVMLRYDWGRGCYARRSRMARERDCSVSKVARAMRELVAARVVDAEQRDGTTTRYRVLGGDALAERFNVRDLAAERDAREAATEVENDTGGESPVTRGRVIRDTGNRSKPYEADSLNLKDTASAKPPPKIHKLEVPKPKPKPQPTKHISPWTKSTDRTPDGDVVPNLPPAKWKLLVEIADETGPDHYREYRNGYIRAAAELDEETLKSLLTQITGGISEGNLDNPGAFFLMRAKKIREQAKS